MAYGYKRTVTIDYTKVPNSTQTDFPVLISSTDNTLRTVGNGGNVENANGYDIGFFSDSALTTPLYWEIESYNASTGEVIAWVKVPSLSHTTNTVIYMGYGDSGISTFQSTASSVWDSNFKGVYHMADNAANTNVTDSTSNANTGTNYANTSTRTTTGKVNSALSYTSGSTDLGDDTDYDITSGDFTISWWDYSSAYNADGPFRFVERLTTSGAGGIPYRGYEISVGGSGGSSKSSTNVFFRSWNTYNYYTYTTTGTIPANTWNYLTFRRSGSTYYWYINGVQDSTGSFNSPYSSAGYTKYLAKGYVAGTTTMDEYRFSNTSRSADWVVTEYNNQNSPGTFYALGSEEAVGGGSGGRTLATGRTLASGRTLAIGRILSSSRTLV